MTIHHLVTKMVIRLGMRNPLVRFLISRRCRSQGVNVAVHDNVVEIRKQDRRMLIAARHFVYVPDLARRFETYFSPIVPTIENGYSIVDYSRPGLQTYAKSGLQFELAAFPEEDEAIEGYFKWYRPQLGDMVFDIGAHCGVSSYVLSKLVGSRGRVIALEPDPLNYSLLVRNIARHHLENVVPLRIALSGSRGVAQFNSEGTIGSCLTHQSSRATVGLIETVETMTLSDVCNQWGTPAFCKIDIEGSEVEVIASAEALLTEERVQFAVDTNHFVKGRLTNAEVEKLFAKYGYYAESSKVAGMMTTWARPFDLPRGANRAETERSK